VAARSPRTAAGALVGFLDPRSPDAVRDRLRAFRQGLKETGYVDRDPSFWDDVTFFYLPAARVRMAAINCVVV
jgi:hypothetical protein